MTAADEARAEAERRYPPMTANWNTPAQDGEAAERREVFEAGAEWQASRDSAEVARAGEHLARMNREWTKVAAINESLTAQLQAAQATIASVRELGGAILRESHCGYLGRDILTLVGDADTSPTDNEGIA